MVRIKIIKRPAGEAPEWVRDAWIGLELIAVNAFDLATLDVNLNGERSDPVADALADRGVSFAFSTGYGEHGLSNRHAGRPVLNKPFNRPQFTAVLIELLRLRDTPSVAA